MSSDLLKKIIKWCLYIALGTPMFVSGGFVFPYVFPKTALLQILVEIAFACWLLLVAVDANYLPRIGRLTKTVALWLFVVFFASLVGVNFYHSLWSSYERMTGLVTLFHYFAYFIILISVLKKEAEWLLMLDISVGVSLAVGLIGLLQKFGALMSPAGSRIAASFGNPSFFAAYLIFNLFFAGLLLSKRYHLSEWRWYYYSALAFQLLMIILTVTRGAIISLAIGIFILIGLFLFSPPSRLKELKPDLVVGVKKWLIIGLVSLVIVIGLLAAFHRQLNNPTLNNLFALSLKEPTAQTRLMSWGMAWQGWKERPLLGWGWENYNVVFNKFYNPYLFPIESWFDRAHNIFFDTIVTTGLFGLLSYLAIFVVCFLTLIRGYKQDKVGFFTFSLLVTLLVVYFLQNLFVFDMLHSYLMFFLVLGFIHFIEKGIEGEQPVESVKKKIIPSSALAASVFILLLLALWFVNIKPALASHYTIRGFKEAGRRLTAGFYKQDKALESFNRSFQYGTFGYWENSLRFSEYAFDTLVAKDRVFEDELKTIFNSAIAAMEKAVRANPKDARYQLMLGSLYYHGSQFDQQRILLAEQTLTRALELSPTKQDTMFILSQTKLMLGKKDEALVLLKRAVEINPRAGQSHWTLGLFYLIDGQKDLAQEEIKTAGRFGYGLNAERAKKLATMYDKLGYYEDIVPVYKRIIELEPNNAQWHASLAATYAKLGRAEEARQEAQIAIDLNPALKAEAEQFLKSF